MPCIHAMYAWRVNMPCNHAVNTCHVYMLYTKVHVSLSHVIHVVYMYTIYIHECSMSSTIYFK